MRICEDLAIVVVLPGMIKQLDASAAALPVNGFTVRIDDRVCILIRSLFTAGELNRRTAFHELGHVLLGHLDVPRAPTADLFQRDFLEFERRSEVAEVEADLFAEIMLAD